MSFVRFTALLVLAATGLAPALAQEGDWGGVKGQIVWGGAEEPVEVVRTWREERDGERRLAFRLALADGTELDVSRSEPDGEWRLDREGDRPADGPAPTPDGGRVVT